MRDYISGELNYRELFDKTNVDKQWTIRIYKDNSLVATLDNSMLYNQGIVIKESLCESEQLQFGGCISSELDFTMSATAYGASLKGAVVKVWVRLNEDETDGLYIGKFIVDSDSKSADSNTRQIVAYDSLGPILNTDVVSWYDTILPNDDSQVTLFDFRNSLFTFLGVEQEPAELVNDGMMINRTISANQLSANMVIKSICEINGIFGRINHTDHFVYLNIANEGNPLYPRDDLYPSDTLYPSNGNCRSLSQLGSGGGGFLGGNFETFQAKRINKVTIRTEEDDVGASAGDGENVYIVTSNFLCFGKGTSELVPIAERLLNNIKTLEYIPYTLMCQGNLCYELGDGVLVQTRNGFIRSYIINRVMTGCQYIKDEYSASGVEERVEALNTVSEEIVQLKGKTNTLKRTIEESVSTIEDKEAGLQTQITQTASRIESVASTANGAYSIASQTASEISNYVRLGTSYSGMKITSDGITIESTGALQIKAGNFKLDANGNIDCVGGTIGGWSISNSYLYSGNVSGGTFAELTPTQILYRSNGKNTEIVAGRIDTYTVSSWEGQFATLEVDNHSLSWITIEGHKVLGYD